MRSRTPVRDAQPETPALPSASTPPLPALHHGSAHDNMPGDRTVQPPTIDLTGAEDDIHADNVVPQTPPELKMLPAKRAIGSEHGPELAEGPAPSGQGSSGAHSPQADPLPVSLDFQDGSQQNSQQSAVFDGLMVNEDHIELVEDSFDGTPDVFMPWNNNSYKAYQTSADYNGDGISDISDIELDDMRGRPHPSTGSRTRPDRIEQKQMEKEIPWRHIVEVGGSYLDAFIESAKAEEASWKAWGSVEPLSRVEAEEIFRCPIRRKRILRSRAAYRDKAKGMSAVKAKTRVVALGHMDPDLTTLCRQSATPMRQSEYLVYTIYIAGKNGKLLDCSTEWVLWVGDVKTAFLQGDPEPRDQPLFLLPPQDGITKAAQTFQSPLYRIRGNLYGLADAPRTWTNHVVKTLTAAGFQQHTLDKMMFFRYAKLPGHEHESLVAVLVAYVDDFVLAHSSFYDRKHLLSLFTWGSSEELSLEKSVEFKGKNYFPEI